MSLYQYQNFPEQLLGPHSVLIAEIRYVEAPAALRSPRTSVAMMIVVVVSSVGSLFLLLKYAKSIRKCLFKL
jgi:hypothetical protein